MKYIYLLLIVFCTLDILASKDDSIIIKNIDPTAIKTINPSKIKEVQSINRFDLFLDSINHSMPDSVYYHDWITNDIHQRKFDFSEFKDTMVVVLSDHNYH